MLKVVSNTTPVISLLKIEKLHLLRDLYNEICIPGGVFHEVEAGKDKTFYTDLSKIEWIKIREVKNKKALSYFLDLDKGEAETIILATEMNADLVIMDEFLGRLHAQNSGLKITGTLGVLLKAKQEGLIKKIKPLLLELKKKRIWLSRQLVNEILDLAGER